jgi:hypothetical protein
VRVLEAETLSLRDYHFKLLPTRILLYWSATWTVRGRRRAWSRLIGEIGGNHGISLSLALRSPPATFSCGTPVAAGRLAQAAGQGNASMPCRVLADAAGSVRV